MRVTVEYMAQLKRLTGCAAEVVDAGACSTLGAVLTQLAERHGPAFRGSVLTADGQPHRSLLFFVGDEPATPAQVLHDGARVTILSPMAGG